MAKGGKAKRRPRGAKRNAILASAMTLVADHGVDGFTVNDIAKKANVNRALVYHYFGSRDGLVRTALEEVVRRSTAVRPAFGPDLLRRAAQAQIDHPELGRVFLQYLAAGRWPPALGDRVMATVRDLRNARAECTEPSGYDPALAIIVVAFSALVWVAAREHVAKELGISLEEADEQFMECVAGDSIAELHRYLDAAFPVAER